MNENKHIIRVEKNRNFTVIHNEFLRRKDLSWKAKGILAYVLHLPDDWEIRVTELIRHATDGKASFYSGWKELIKAGYVKSEVLKDPKTNQFEKWQTIIYEKPLVALKKNNKAEGGCSVGIDLRKPDSGKPDSGKPDSGKPDAENQQLLNTNELSTDELSTNESNTNKLTSAKLEKNFAKLWSIYPNKKGRKKALSAYKKAVISGITDEKIKKGIESYCKEIEVNKIKPNYIAHGSTWFSHERWNDDYDLKDNKINFRGYSDGSQYADY